jgi:hypothetical protein
MMEPMDIGGKPIVTETGCPTYARYVTALAKLATLLVNTVFASCCVNAPNISSNVHQEYENGKDELLAYIELTRRRLLQNINN